MLYMVATVATIYQVCSFYMKLNQITVQKSPSHSQLQKWLGIQTQIIQFSGKINNNFVTLILVFNAIQVPVNKKEKET